MDTTHKFLKTGTTTLAIMCSDGIVVAADKRATAGNFIAERDMDKVIPLVDDILITTAGVVSEVQKVVKLARAELKLLEVKTNRSVTVKDAANLLSSMAYYSLRSMGEIGIVSFLVAGKDRNGFSLFDIDPDGTIKKDITFRSSGSGSTYALPILEAEYKKDIKIQDAIKLAVKAINQAQLRDTASGNGFDVFTITAEGMKKVITKDITPKAEV